MHRPTSLLVPLFFAGLALPACAPDLQPGDDEASAADDNGDGGTGELADDPQMDHESNGDHVITQVDATDAERWIYMDLESGRQVEESDGGWDLRFQRYQIAVNGGISGDGGIEVAWVADATIDKLVSAPADGWSTDAEDGDDEDEEPDLAFADWYDYDAETHVLTPREGVYVVRTVDSDYAVQILDYYSDAGTSGYPTFAWRDLNAGE